MVSKGEAMTDTALVDLERRLRKSVSGDLRLPPSPEDVLAVAEVFASLRSERMQLQGLIRKWRAKDAEQTRWYQAADQLEAVLSEGRPSLGEGAASPQEREP